MRRVPLLLALLWAAAVGAASFDSGNFDTSAFDPGAFDFGGSTTTVPDCTTDPTLGTDCALAVVGAGLVAEVLPRCNAMVATGYVISTIPPAGTTVDVGSTVEVRVSTGVCPAFATGSGGLGVGGMGVGMP